MIGCWWCRDESEEVVLPKKRPRGVGMGRMRGEVRMGSEDGYWRFGFAGRWLQSRCVFCMA